MNGNAVQLTGHGFWETNPTFLRQWGKPEETSARIAGRQVVNITP
jgi:hypothetical protein